MTAGWVKRKLHLHYSFTSVFFFKKKSSKQTKHPNVTLCDLHNGVWHMKKWKNKDNINEKAAWFTPQRFDFVKMLVMKNMCKVMRYILSLYDSKKSLSLVTLSNINNLII